MGFKKGQKITDPAVLERLKKARVKALETRRANAQKKKDAKIVNDLEKRKAQKEVERKLTQHAAATHQPAPAVAREASPEPPRRKKRLKRKTKKRIVYVTDSSETDSETEEMEVRRPISWAEKQAQKREAKNVRAAQLEAQKLLSEREVARAEAKQMKSEREAARAEAAILKKERQERKMAKEAERLAREKLKEEQEAKARAAPPPKREPVRSQQDLALDAMFQRCYGRR